MRLANCEIDGNPRIALSEGDDLRLLARDCPDAVTLAMHPATVGKYATGDVVAAAAVTFLQPVLAPGKILCVGVNYRSHAAEGGRPPQDPDHPSLFVRFPESQVAHQQKIVLPAVSAQLDYEGELAVIIGRPAWRVSPAGAMAHVAGFSCFADNAIRDFQRHATQATAGKNFLASGAFGPWLTTPDEVGPLDGLRLRTRLNGDVVQDAALGEMIFSVEALIAYISQFTRLMPGDVIATGTPSGVGALRSPPSWLRVGDRLEFEIDNVGCLRTEVAAEHRAGEAGS